MVTLSKNLSSFLCKNFFILDDKTTFDEDELERVKRISISKNEIEYLKYFPNIEILEIELFPSINDNDLREIAELLPNVKALKVKEQQGIINVDLSNYKKLEELCIIHNENLLSIKGLNKLTRLTCYDNKEYDNYNELCDFMINNKSCEFVLDIVYYIYILRLLDRDNMQLLDNVKWVEVTGLRKFNVVLYSIDEVKELYNNLTDIISKYVYVTDEEIDKFGILYQWMIDNVEFINEDVERKENLDNFNTSYKVFSYMKAGRVGYAKAFQLLLSVVGINSKMVYSMGAYEKIGFYDGKKVYSLMGQSDYALLRVRLDNRNYYSDMAWNRLTRDYPFADKIRMVLIAKEDLKIRQKFVGEGNVTKSYTYHEEELLLFAEQRILEVDKYFDAINQYDSLIIGDDINYNYTNSSIKKMEEELTKYNSVSNEYKEILFSIEESKNLRNNYITEINNYNELRRKWLNDNAKLLIVRYLGDNYDLDRKLLNYELSNDLYNILKEINS